MGEKKCKHNKRKDRCIECDGSQICIHRKRKENCIECGGSQICQHKRIKSQCKDCDGSQICVHEKQKAKCIECGGSQICQHQRQREYCIDCSGSQICNHGKRKAMCIECDGSGFCQHKRIKGSCKDCDGSQICVHNKQKYYCIICAPNSKAFCIKCRLFQVRKDTNFLCSYCNPERKQHIKTKENNLKVFLEQQKYTIEYNKTVRIDTSCQLYFPDFVIDNGSLFIVIECDENAHKGYPMDCEKIRENNITFQLGLPCVFLRWNPDKKNVKMKTKLMVLKSTIDFYKSHSETNPETVYLFY